MYEDDEKLYDSSELPESVSYHFKRNASDEIFHYMAFAFVLISLGGIGTYFTITTMTLMFAIGIPMLAAGIVTAGTMIKAKKRLKNNDFKWKYGKVTGKKAYYGGEDGGSTWTVFVDGIPCSVFSSTDYRDCNVGDEAIVVALLGMDSRFCRYMVATKYDYM